MREKESEMMRNSKSGLCLVVLTCLAASALFNELDPIRHWGDIDGRAKGVATKNLRHDFQSNEKQKFLYQRYLSYDDGVHHPTFSIIDVSYDDYSPSDSEYEQMANEDKSTSYIFTGESEPVTPPPTLVTLPIFVIGFSGTIVICGLFMLYSEFRARRNFNKDMIMLIQSISSNSSIAFSNERSLQSSAISTDPQNSKRTLDSIFGPIHADADSCTRERQKENYVPIIPCICDSSTENLSSLYYDVNHPEQFYCKKAVEAAVAAWKGQNRNSKNHPDRLFLEDHRDWEILFYRSEDSTSMSVASTITKSLPLDCGTKNVDYPPQCNESNDCKIMELTEIHRVSTGITIESLVELGTISAATASFAKPSSLCSTTLLHTADQQDTTEINLDEDQNNESGDDQAVEETKHDAHFQIEIQRDSLPDYPSVRKCSISDFDAGTPPIAEVMTGEDCVSADGSDNIEMVNFRDETVVEDKDEKEGMRDCSSGKSEESSFVMAVAAASSNISSAASSVDDIEFHVTEVNSVDSLNTAWIETLEPPPSTVVLDEGSLVEVAERDGYTRVENEYGISRVEDEKANDKEASGKDEIFERQDEYIDCIRPSSSSVDASTITNCNNREDRTCR